jgi:hypothetical protein
VHQFGDQPRSDYSYLIGARIKNEWSYMSTAPYASLENMGVILTLYTKLEVSAVRIVQDADMTSHPRRPESSKICFPSVRRLDRP